LEELSLLGNAAAVPIIIGATQLLKKNFSFKYKADVVSFVMALVICPVWWFYKTPEVEILDALDDGLVTSVKFGMQLILISIATWLSATKSYDLFSGTKKREAKRQVEKDELQEKINELEMTLESGGKSEDDDDDENEIRDKLLEILGERN